MKLDLFANRISRVLFVGGVVRIEFCLLQPNENGEISPDTAVSPEDVHFTVTLPLGGYSRSTQELRKFTQDLQAKGILKQQDQGEQGGGRPEGGRPPEGGPRGGPRGGGPQGGRPQQRQGGGPGARKQRELTDLTSDSGNEPLV